MKRFGSSFGSSSLTQGSTQRMQWMLSMVALLLCLWSVASVHSHESGLHTLGDSCISCNLEDVTAHGSGITLVVQPNPNLSFIEPTRSFAALRAAAARAAAPIRAPPLFS